MTGFLNEKPLANLRDDEKNCISRSLGTSDPEDHIASLWNDEWYNYKSVLYFPFTLELLE